MDNNHCLRGKFFLNKFYQGTIKIFMILILSALSLSSVLVTAYMSQSYAEKTFFQINRIIIVLFVFFTIIGVIFFYDKLVIKVDEKKVLYSVLLISFCFSIFLVFVLNPPLRGDQLSIYENAVAMNHGDSSVFDVGKYLQLFPHQLGLVLINEVLFALFQDKTILVFRIINCIGLVVLVYGLHEICKLLFNSSRVLYIFDLLILGCFPLFYFVTFYYGNILTMTFATLAIMYQLRYLKKERLMRYVIVSAICISIAIVIKSNSLIFLVGIILQYLFFLNHHMKKRIWCIVLSILSVLIFQNCVNLYYEIKTDATLEDSIPKVAWIAMGLQDSNRGPGWYNGYPRIVYSQSHANTQLAAEKSVDSINDSIHKFIKNPKYAISFFGKKTISQWNNPSFQCFWIQDKIENENVGSYLINEASPLREIQESFMDGYEFLVYLMALICVWIKRKDDDLSFIQLELIFIGGFIFHIIWEAKGQYTLQYFILVIPYAAYGIERVIKRMNQLLRRMKIKKHIM